MPVQGFFRNADRVVEVPAGGIVFSEGDAGNEMFGVVSGKAGDSSPATA